MLKTCFGFLLAGFIALFFVDFEISTINPIIELSKIANGILCPSFARFTEIYPSIFTTVAIAIVSITISIIIGSIIAFFYNQWYARAVCIALRSVHEIFWALLLIPIFGLTPLSAVLAITIPFIGIFAKVFSEIESESNKAPRQALSKQTSKLSGFIYTILPLITPAMFNYIRYRFECALRSSAVLGFLGIPTIGFYLETMFREGYYHQAAGLLIIFYMLIFSLRYWLKTKILIIITLIAFAYIFKSENLHFYTTGYLTELTPWPLRSTQSFHDWFLEIYKLGAQGLINTISLTQVSIVSTAILAILLIPMSSIKFVSKSTKNIFHILLIILRTTPELFIAYLFLVLLGPSMLPAVIALTLHNAAIMAYLSVGLCDKLDIPEGVYKRKLDSYFFWFLPQLFGQFIAFLFLRWEVMIRDSALLGIIGIYTIGFYIDSAISDQHLDVALALIILSGLLTLMVDTTSHIIRKRLRLEGITTCVQI